MPSSGVKTCALPIDRKSTRLNSNHLGTSYAVFCLKKQRSVHRAFLLCPPEGQQGYDVLAGERRGRAVGGVQPLEGAVQANGGVVIADPGGRKRTRLNSSHL